MKCPEELGVPLSLQIWHDNSGGKEAGWYLGKVVFIDLQQKRWSVYSHRLHSNVDYTESLTSNYICLCQIEASDDFHCAGPKRKLRQCCGYDDHLKLSKGHNLKFVAFS